MVYPIFWRIKLYILRYRFEKVKKRSQQLAVKLMELKNSLECVKCKYCNIKNIEKGEL